MWRGRDGRLGRHGNTGRRRIVVEASCVGVRRGRAAAARRKNELRGLVAGAGDEQHVAGGAIEELAEHLGEASRTIVTEDAFFRDSTRNGDTGDSRDLVKDLVEARVIGLNTELIFDVGDVGAVGRWSWGRWTQWRLWCW